MDAFVDRLHQLGWIDGESLTIEFRIAESHAELLSQLAAELISLPVEIIVAVGALAIAPAQQQTNTIPIVMVDGTDPTSPSTPASVQSVARPGSNVTGDTFGITTVGIKSVELLKTVLPYMARLTYLHDKSSAGHLNEITPVLETAQTLGIQILDLDVRQVVDVDTAIESARAWGTDALLVTPLASYAAGIFASISELADRDRLPVMYGLPVAVTDSGGLMAFSPDLISNYRQGAEYVDKILRGAAPADLPVQEPRQFDFVVNVKAAQQLGITFPPDAAAQVTQWVQ
jgi:putative ABC transport system substrate-binding protein